MRDTVLGVSWRWLLAGLRRRSPDRRNEQTDSSSPHATGPFVPDGGSRREREDEAHLHAVPDGAGCTEIWEHLSDRQVGVSDTDD